MEVGALKTRISLDSAQFEQGMAGVNRQLKALQHEQKAATSSGTGFARGVNELRDKSDVLNRTLELQRAKVRELARRYEESKKATGENSKETQNAQIEYQKAVAEMRKTENALQGITAELERQTNPWNVLSQNMTEMGTKLQTAGRYMTDFGKSWTMRVTTPIVGLGVAALKVGMDFEASMSKVQALTGATGEEMEAMTDQAKHLGETTIFSASQAAEGMAFLGMAGWDTKEILAGMPGLLNLAAAGAMDLGRAADIASNIMSGFAIDAQEAGRVSDILAYAASNSNTNLEQLGEAMKYVAPMANTLGISIEDSAAAMMGVADAGLQGSMGGRAFATSLTRLAQPTSKMKKEMDKLKLSFFDSEGAMKPLPDIIEEIEEATDGMTDKQQAATLSTLFGAEAQKHWAVLLSQGSEKLRENSQALSESEGSAERMAKTMTDNARGAVIEFKSALEGVGIALAEHMIPAITDAVKWGTDLVRKFGELDEGTQKNIIKMAAFAAAIGPAAIVLGNLTTAIGGVLRVGGSLAGMLGAAGGKGLLGRIGMLGLGAAGPVGLAIAGVGALGLAIWDWKKKTDDAKKTNLELVQSLNDQHTEIEAAAAKYEELRSKSEITTEQMKELLEIRYEMAKNPEGEALEELQKRYDGLVEKTGLTKDEVEELLDANASIIDQAPQVAEAHTVHGEAVAGVGEELQKLVDNTLEVARAEAELQRGNWAEERTEHIRNAAQAEKDREETLNRIALLTELQNEDQMVLNDRLNEAKDISGNYLYTQEQQNEARREADVLEAILNGKAGELRDTLKAQLDEQNNIIAAAEEHRLLGEQLDAEYLQILLKSIGINEEGQKGVDVANEQLNKLKEQKAELEGKIKREGDQTGTLRDQLGVINDQIGAYEATLGLIDREIGSVQTVTGEEKKRERQIAFNNDILAQASGIHDSNTAAQGRTNAKIDEGTGKAEDMNRTLGQDIDKSVDVDDNGTAKAISDEASKSATKRVTLSAVWKNVASGLSAGIRSVLGNIPGFAEGTNSAPGGPALVGEEGYELARHGNKWAILDAGIVNLPRGTQVFTHDETKKILSSLNKIPAYATGVSPSGEADRIVRQLNGQQSSSLADGKVIALLQDIADGIKAGHVITVDKRVLGKVVAPEVTQEQQRALGRSKRNARLNV